MNYYRRNRLAWQLLNDDAFFEEMAKIIQDVYSRYIEELEYCTNHSRVCLEPAFKDIDIRKILEAKEKATGLIAEKRGLLKSYYERLPELEVAFKDEAITATGKSLVGFKVKKNGWRLESVENMTVFEESDEEAVFLINLGGAHSVVPLDIYLKPKSFKLVLRREGKANEAPQLASLYSDNYKTILDIKLLEDEKYKEEVMSPPLEASLPQIIEQIESEHASPSTGSIINHLVKLYQESVQKDVFTKLNNRDYIKVYLERLVLLWDQWQKRDYLPSGQVVRWSGEKILKQTTVVPYDSKLILEPGAVLKLGPKVSLIVEGSFIAQGTAKEKVLITSLESGTSLRGTWGSICFVHSLSQDSKMEYTIVENGSEDHLMGVYCKGALSAYHVPFTLENVEFRNNKADDAVNFLYSMAEIRDSYFHDNKSDAVDLDFSTAQVERVEFYNNGNDGVDCGTSFADIKSNIFRGQKDKGVSVGEESEANITGNFFLDNNIAVAVKDNSKALFKDNVFSDNQYAVKAYIKKSKYGPPQANFLRNYVYNNQFDYFNDGAAQGAGPGAFVALAGKGEIKNVLTGNYLKNFAESSPGVLKGSP